MNLIGIAKAVIGWTPTPWHLGEGFSIVGGDGMLVQSSTRVPASSALRSSAEADANRRRIVECVNAAAGFERPIELRRRHDELLAFAEMIAGSCDDRAMRGAAAGLLAGLKEGASS